MLGLQVLLRIVATIFFLIVCVSVVEAEHEHRCHVCVPGAGTVGQGLATEVEQLFPGTSLVSCRQSTDVKVCPDSYKGCLTQTRGDEVMRTCAQLAVNTCRAANSVEYCYCTGDLCNAPPEKDVTIAVAVTDDEDLAEGSGNDHQASQNTPQPKNATTSRPTVTTVLQNNLTSSAITMLREPATIYVIIFVVVWR